MWSDHSLVSLTRVVCHRPLYDAYNHRIDYGEGEWPSVWPSEIQQDEFHGWHFVNGDPHATAALPDAYTSPGRPQLELAAITSPSQWSHHSGVGHVSHHQVDAFLPNYSMISSDEESSLVIAPTYHGQPPVDAGQAGWTKHWDAANAREFYYNNVRIVLMVVPVYPIVVAAYSAIPCSLLVSRVGIGQLSMSRHGTQASVPWTPEQMAGRNIGTTRIKRSSITTACLGRHHGCGQPTS
jgi:hypothetical protein